MAYTDDERENPEFVQASGPPPSVASGAAPSTSVGAPPSQGSGRFVNFDRLFALAQPQLDQQTQAIAGDVEGQITQAQKEAGTAAYGVQQQAEQAGNAVGNQKFAGTASDGEHLYDWDAATYSGPTGVSDEDASKVRRSIQGAQSSLNATQDPYGLQALLQKHYGGGYQTASARRDAALLGQAGGDRFAALRERYGALDGIMNQMNADATGAVDKAKDQIATGNTAGAQTVATHNAGVDQREQAYQDFLLKEAQEQMPKTGKRRDPSDPYDPRNRRGPGASPGHDWSGY